MGNETIFSWFREMAFLFCVQREVAILYFIIPYGSFLIIEK